jgi:hypothetical protein
MSIHYYSWYAYFRDSSWIIPSHDQPMNVTKQTSLNFQIDLKQIYDLLLDLSLCQQIVEKKKLLSYLLYLFYVVTRYTNNSIGTQKYCLKDSSGLSCTFQNYLTHADVRLCNCSDVCFVTFMGWCRKSLIFTGCNLIGYNMSLAYFFFLWYTHFLNQ